MFRAAPVETIAQLTLHGLWNRSKIMEKSSNGWDCYELPGVLIKEEQEELCVGGDHFKFAGGSRAFLFLANQTTFEPASLYTT